MFGWMEWVFWDCSLFVLCTVVIVLEMSGMCVSFVTGYGCTWHEESALGYLSPPPLNSTRYGESPHSNSLILRHVHIYGDDKADSGFFRFEVQEFTILAMMEVNSSGVWQTQRLALARKNSVMCPLQGDRPAAAGQAATALYPRKANANQTEWHYEKQRIFDIPSFDICR